MDFYTLYIFTIYLLKTFSALKKGNKIDESVSLDLKTSYHNIVIDYIA